MYRSQENVFWVKAHGLTWPSSSLRLDILQETMVKRSMLGLVDFFWVWQNLYQKTIHST